MAKAATIDRKRAFTATGSCRAFPRVVCRFGGSGIQGFFSGSLETEVLALRVRLREHHSLIEEAAKFEHSASRRRREVSLKFKLKWGFVGLVVPSKSWRQIRLLGRR